MTRGTTEKFLLDLLDALRAADAVLEEPTLVLVKNDIYPSKDKLYADLELATFGGYTDRTAIAFGSAHKDSDGKYRIVAPTQFYEVTSVPDPVQRVYGYALVNAGKTLLHQYVRLTTPIVISQVNQGFTIEPVFQYGD